MSGGDLMASGGGPSFRELREAVDRYVRENGVRAISREARLSPSVVERIVKGEARPRGFTVRKLGQWFVQPASE